MKVLTFSEKKRTWFFVCIFAIVLFAVINLSWQSTASVSAGRRLLPIYRVKNDEKTVALTFDAAWGNEDTQQLIDILAKYKAKATFFLVGNWVTKYPESVKALADAGHEIGNHSDTHPHFSKMSREEMKKNIMLCNEKIYTVMGKLPTVFRAPYGEYNNLLIETMADTGMSCIQWDVDSHDWMDLSAPQITDRVLKQVKSGSIVLFHNAALHTPEALPGILETLSKEGYRFVSISDLIYTQGYSIDNKGEQYLG